MSWGRRRSEGREDLEKRDSRLMHRKQKYKVVQLKRLLSFRWIMKYELGSAISLKITADMVRNFRRSKYLRNSSNYNSAQHRMINDPLSNHKNFDKRRIKKWLNIEGSSEKKMTELWGKLTSKTSGLARKRSDRTRKDSCEMQREGQVISQGLDSFG